MSLDQYKTIGVIHSCFKEKFGIPRQPGLAPSTSAVLTLSPPFDTAESVRGLTEFTHIWVIYIFHANKDRLWRPTVRPPRLGGNRRVGVWASRSPLRPNPIGISAVRLSGIDTTGDRTRLFLEGGDFLDGTPVIDIKPYIRYADSIPEAASGYAHQPPPERPVFFTDQAEILCKEKEKKGIAGLKNLITQVLRCDPRPAYIDSEARRRFGVRLHDMDIHWETRGESIWVVDIVEWKQ